MCRLARLLPLCLLGATIAGHAADTKPATTPAGTPTATAPKPVPRTELKEQVKPGATIKMDFPELTVDRHGNMAACNISLPEGYDPAKKFPLVVWLGGGEGGNTPSRAFLPEGDFIAVGLPYPKGAANPAQANMVGDFGKIWAYHRKMIDEVQKLLPNIDRKTSVIAGFSNGGHAIDGMLRAKVSGPGLLDYFGILILVDGGGTDYTSKGSLPSLAGKQAYICWGEKSPNKGSSSRLAREFKSRRAETLANEMTNVGHAFDASEQPKVAAWLEKTALPALSKK